MNNVADFLTGSVSPAHLLHTDHHFLLKSSSFWTHEKKTFYQRATIAPSRRHCYYVCEIIWMSSVRMSALLHCRENHHEGQNCRDWGRKRLEMLVFYYPTLTHLQAVSYFTQQPDSRAWNTNQPPVSAFNNRQALLLCIHTHTDHLWNVFFMPSKVEFW